MDHILKQRAAEERYMAAQCTSNDRITQAAKRRHEALASALARLVSIRSAVKRATLRATQPFSTI